MASKLLIIGVLLLSITFKSFSHPSTKRSVYTDKFSTHLLYNNGMDKRFEIRPGRVVHCTLWMTPGNHTTIFLIHGLGGRAEQWREQIPILAKKYNVVAIDLFGHGLSDKPSNLTPNPLDFANMLQDLQELYNRYHTEKNIIIGHSYGGALAAMLAFNNQKAVQKLILISPLPCEPFKHLPLVYHLPTQLLEWIKPLLTKQFVRLAFYDQNNEKLIHEEVCAAHKNKMEIIKATLQGMETINLLAREKFKIPTLIILGQHDGIVPSASSYEFYKHLPRHQFIMLDESAHMAILEQPQRVNQSIQEFLTSTL